MIVRVGQAAPLFVALEDADTGKFPRAVIRSAAAGATVATVDLAHVVSSSGYYHGTWTVSAEGIYSVTYTVFTDSGHTTVDTSYARTVDVIETPDKGSGPTVQGNVTYDPSSNILRAHSWLLSAGAVETTGDDATFRLFDRSGTALIALTTDAAPDANGVFAFNVTAPSFSLGETACYAVFSVDVGTDTYRTVVGMTFSRLA